MGFTSIDDDDPALDEFTDQSLGFCAIGRSQFFVKGICCASEVPQVESILRPVEGVVEVSVNPTTRTGEFDCGNSFLTSI